MYDVITGHKNIYVNNFSQNRGRTVTEVSLCLSRQGASTGMQHDLPGSIMGQLPGSRKPDLRSNFHIGLSGLKCICFDAP